MNDKKVFTGLGMLLTPLFLGLGYLLIASQLVTWKMILMGILVVAGLAAGITYVVIAFSMIIKGAFLEDVKGGKKK